MIHLLHAILHWLAVHTGTYIPPGQYSDWYNFWSGFGSDLTEFALLGGIITIYHHHNCDVPRCPRIKHKKYVVKGTPLETCHKHFKPEIHADLLRTYIDEHPEQHAFYNSEERQSPAEKIEETIKNAI